MPSSKPIADVDTTGWVDQASNPPPLFARLADATDATYSKTDRLGPVGNFQAMFLMDDVRISDRWQKIQPGWWKNGNQLVLKDLLAQDWLRYLQARCCVAYCGPERFTLQTGNNAPNHGVYDTGTAAGYKRMREGIAGPGVGGGVHIWGGTTRIRGPWGIDLAYKLGAWMEAINPGNAIGAKLRIGEPVLTTDLIAEVDVILGQAPGTNALVATLSGSRRRGFNDAGGDNVGRYDGTNVTGPGATAVPKLPLQLANTVDGGGHFIDNIQMWSGGLFPNLGRPDILGVNGWVGAYGKLDNYFGKIGQAPWNVADPQGEQWDFTQSYPASGGTSVHWNNIFFTSKPVTGNVNHAPPVTGSDSFWTRVGPPRTSRWVLPGHSHLGLFSDDAQDHFRFKILQYKGSLTLNPGWGDGVIGDEWHYNALLEIQSIAWLNATDGIEITLKQPPSRWKNGVRQDWNLVVGESLAVRMVEVTGGPMGSATRNNDFNTTGKQISWVHPSDNKIFRIPQATNPLGGGGVIRLTSNPGRYSHVVPRKMQADQVLRALIAEHLEHGQVTRKTNGILYWGTRMPHDVVLPGYNNATQNPSDPVNEYAPWVWGSDFHQQDLDISPEYRNPRGFDDQPNSLAVVPSVTGTPQWEGIDGNKSPAVTTWGSGDAITYAERACMYASFNDAYVEFKTHMATLRGSYEATVNEWLMGDNGWQEEDHANVETNAGSPVGGKLCNREASQRLMFYRRKIGQAAGVDRTTLTGCIDLFATLCDEFSQTNHFAHLRDGVSLNRDQSNRRYRLGYGKYRSSVPGNDESLLNGQSLIRRDVFPVTGSPKIVAYRRRFDDQANQWEVNNITSDPASPVGANATWGTEGVLGLDGLTSGERTTIDGELNLAQFWEFDAFTGTNPWHSP